MPRRPEEDQLLKLILDVAWAGAMASQQIEGIDVPQDLERPDLDLSSEDVRRLIDVPILKT